MARLKVMRLFFTMPDMFEREYRAMMDRMDRISLYHPLSLLSDRSIHVGEIVWNGGVEDISGLTGEVENITLVEPLTAKEITKKDPKQLYMIELAHPPIMFELLEMAFREYHSFMIFPWSMTEEGSSIAMAGDPDNLKVLLDILDDIPEANYKVQSIVDYHPPGKGVLSDLTTQQYDAIALAVKNGYYGIPKASDLRKLCQGMDINHSTFSAHIRKGERHIMETLFEED